MSSSSVAQVRAMPVAIRNITQEFLGLRSQYKQRCVSMMRVGRVWRIGFNRRLCRVCVTSFFPRRGGTSRADSLEDPLNPTEMTLKTLPPVWVETVNAVKVDLSLIREKGSDRPAWRLSISPSLFLWSVDQFALALLWFRRGARSTAHITIESRV